MNVFLIGYRCTGKTTIGKKLVQALNSSFADTDVMVEQSAGMSISKIIEKNGWDAFRALETRCLIAAAALDNTVISTGGGIVLSGQNRKIIRSNGTCIWLTADVATIVKRLETDEKTDASRPRFTSHTLLKETQMTLNERLPLYEQTHHIKIDTTQFSIEACVDEICRRLEDVRI